MLWQINKYNNVYTEQGCKRKIWNTGLVVVLIVIITNDRNEFRPTGNADKLTLYKYRHSDPVLNFLENIDGRACLPRRDAHGIGKAGNPEYFSAKIPVKKNYDRLAIEPRWAKLL